MTVSSSRRSTALSYSGRSCAPPAAEASTTGPIVFPVGLRPAGWGSSLVATPGCGRRPAGGTATWAVPVSRILAVFDDEGGGRTHDSGARGRARSRDGEGRRARRGEQDLDLRRPHAQGPGRRTTPARRRRDLPRPTRDGPLPLRRTERRRGRGDLRGRAPVYRARVQD